MSTTPASVHGGLVRGSEANAKEREAMRPRRTRRLSGLSSICIRLYVRWDPAVLWMGVETRSNLNFSRSYCVFVGLMVHTMDHSGSGWMNEIALY